MIYDIYIRLRQSVFRHSFNIRKTSIDDVLDFMDKLDDYYMSEDAKILILTDIEKYLDK